MGVGKDYAAKALNLETIGFADPMYFLAEQFFGTSDKSKPGIRKFLQTVGAWGRGQISEEYPCTAERALFVELMRREGAKLSSYRDAGWGDFGHREDFWINLLLNRARHLDFLAVTNARFDKEVQALREVGFQHYHVTCSSNTWFTRLEKIFNLPPDPNVAPWDYPDIAARLADITEQMAIRLDAEMPDNQVIWNDKAPMPDGKKYLWLEEFVENYKALK